MLFSHADIESATFVYYIGARFALEPMRRRFRVRVIYADEMLHFSSFWKILQKNFNRSSYLAPQLLGRFEPKQHFAVSLLELLLQHCRCDIERAYERVIAWINCTVLRCRRTRPCNMWRGNSARNDLLCHCGERIWMERMISFRNHLHYWNC